MAKSHPNRIRFIIDARIDPPALALSEDFFAEFDVTAFCAYRDLVADARNEGVALVLCGHCGAPVYPSCTGQERIRRYGGDAIFFKHHAGGAAALCPSGADSGIDPDLHDRKRFDGIQEGLRHADLKRTFAGALETDPRASDVAIERVHFHDRRPRRPDVSAQFGGHRLAVEIQVADPQFTTVRKRNAFDREAGLTTVWIMAHDRIEDLARHVNFAAIAVRQDGHIVAWSEAAAAASHAGGRVMVHLVTFAPSGRMSSRLVGLAEALVTTGAVAATAVTPSPVEGGYIAPTARVADLRKALLCGDQDGVAVLARELAVAGGLPWDAKAWHRDLVECGIAACLVALTGRKAEWSRFRDDQAAAILNVFLETARLRVWTPILVAAYAGHPDAMARLSVPSTARKVARNLAAIDEAPGDAARLAQAWSPLLRTVFPKLSANSLQGAPLPA